MDLHPDARIKKQIGKDRPNTPTERLEQLWQLYLFWKATPAGQQEQPIPPHVRKVIRKVA
jgi:hypothetical protein